MNQDIFIFIACVSYSAARGWSLEQPESNMAYKVPYVLLSLFVVIASSQAVTDKEIDEFLDICIDAKYHKSKPGPEADIFNKKFHCTPWKGHACCSANTTFNIQEDGALSLYNMHWDQCNTVMSPKCRRYFEIDTCMYECSPYMKPWITIDPNSKKTRKERFTNVPICKSDCDEWFDACRDDLTCSNNWGNFTTWNWKTGMCKMECKTFKDYFGDPEKFCNQIFNFSWRYTEGKAGEDCMTLWPNGTTNINENVARKYARRFLTTKSSGSKVAVGYISVILLAVLAYLC